MTVLALDQVRPLDRARQAAPQIYERLREAIITLAMPPGSPLSRTDLMDLYGVSQTPIREALIRLADEHLVDVFAQHKTRVSLIDLRHARETHFLRRSIEIEAVQVLALAKDKSFIAPLERDLEIQHVSLMGGDMAPYKARSLTFHSTLLAVADMAPLWTLIRSRSGHIDRIRRMDPPDPATNVVEHIEILAAIAAGSAELAQSLMRAHIGRAFANLEGIREQWPQYF